MSALEISGLRASYGQHAVLEGVDLVVRDGVTAIVGPSGCGKTTLLRAVAGFVTPDAGVIRLAGRTVAGDGAPVPPRKRRIGYVPQEGALFPHLDVAANIAFGLPRTRRRSSAQTVADALELVELSPTLATRRPHELSGGQQQRVALARALAARPGLVLLDEPFSSLDAGLREDTGRAVVRAVRATGAAALLVTHDQGEALSLADQVAVMVDGSFLQVSTPARVYLEPAAPRVATFLGHSTLVDGVVGADGVTTALGSHPLRFPVGAGPARVAVRAEQVQVLARPGRGDGAVAGVTAQVVGVSFFGHDATVRVELADGTELTARTPSGDVPLVGDQVLLHVVGEVVAFPGTAPA